MTGVDTIGDRLTRVNHAPALIVTALGSLEATDENVCGVAVSEYDFLRRRRWQPRMPLCVNSLA